MITVLFIRTDRLSCINLRVIIIIIINIIIIIIIHISCKIYISAETNCLLDNCKGPLGVGSIQVSVYCSV